MYVCIYPPPKGDPVQLKYFKRRLPPSDFPRIVHISYRGLAGSRTSLDAAGCSCKLGINRKTIPVEI